MESKPKTGRGRPTGSTNREYIPGNDVTSACPKCGCTDSEKGHSNPVSDTVEVIRVRCTNPECGQWRFDRRTIGG